MLSFEEMYQSAQKHGELSILLGNGFSQSWNSETFSYSTLYDVAEFGERDEPIRQVFDILNTQDFERVSSRLIASRDIVSLYDENQKISDFLDSDSQIIKDSLLKAIAESHPDRPNFVSKAEYRSVRSFLSKFSKIYTVNYDLLMYWARNQRDLEPFGWSTDDGFREELTWVGTETEQKIYFLHGALHLYECSEGVKKHSFNASGEPIIEKVKNNLRDNVFPLFVSEPTSELKVSRINKNPYLSYCHRKLSREEGCVFILGHGFNDVDRHIFLALDKSRATHIYVSIFGDPESENNRRIRGLASAWLKKEGRDVLFVDAKTVPAWRPV